MPSGKDHPRLSVAIITRNAAEALAETLDSVQHIADEIIVVDTGSTDHTRDVATQHKAKFYTHPWQDDFSAARNHAAQLCAGDWILWLDAGERLSSTAAEALKKFVITQAVPSLAYMLVVRLPVQPGEIAGEQVGVIRLVPNDPALKFTGRVRETLLPSITAAQLQIEGLPYRIDRGTRELDVQTKQRRAKRNITLAELAMRDHGPRPQWLNCLGDAFHVLGQNERAAQYYRQAISLSEKGSSDMLAGYYGLIVALESSDQGRAAQLNTCAAALDIYPLDAQLLCASGGYLQSLGKLDMACKAYQTAYRFGRVNPEVWHLDGIIEVAVACYCQTLQMQQQYEAAQAVLEEQLQNYPESLRLRRQLLSLYIRLAKRKEAIAQVERLPPETPYLEALQSAVRGACLAASKNWGQALAYLESAYRQGCRDVICLQWYTLTLLSQGDVSAAMPVLAEWRAADPHHPDLAPVLAAAAEAATHGQTISVQRQLRLDNNKTLAAATHLAAQASTVSAAPN